MKSKSAVNSNSEVRFLADQLRRSMDGPAWHGSALMELLQDLPVDMAPAKPLEHAHSIWEIVLHISAWFDPMVRRMNGEIAELSGAKDWPPVTDVSEAAWARALKDLRQNHLRLLEAVGKLSDAQLSNKVPGRDHDVRFMLTGLAQHTIYHAGQVAVLKKSSR